MIKSRAIWLNLTEWAILSLAVAAFTITEQYHWYITAGLLLLPVAFGLRWVRTGKFISRTGLELPMLLFLVTAGVATWIAVDRGTALLQFARMLAAAGMYFAVVQSEKQLRPWLVAGMVLITFSLALYWPLQHDFAADLEKFPLIAQTGVWIREHFPTIPGPFVHAYVAASTFAPGLAFTAALAAWAGRRKPWLVGLSGMSALLVIPALGLTSCRGAWLGAGVVILMAVLVLIQRKYCYTLRLRRRFWGILLLIGLIGLALLILSGLWEPLLGKVPDPSGTFQSRLSLWQQVLLLIGDAPITGFGLMGFRPVYSTYGLLIHVPFHYHAHNTYLEVGFEQGIPALLALLWGMVVVLLWTWRALERGKASPWGWAGLAALGVLAVHSIFDVVYYVTRPLPLIGFFAGMTWMLNQTPSSSSQTPRITSHRTVHWLVSTAVIGAGLILLIAFFRPLLSTWYANLGVIEQTRLELTAYDAAHFDNPTLDEVRQQLDLSRALSYFEQSLSWDADNRTALQRIAQISLSQGAYSVALDLMQEAWDSGKQDEITRLLFGDALVAEGRPETAAVIISGLPWAVGRLNTQAWSRYYRQADYERAAYAWHAVLLLDPTNTQALNGLQAIPQP
jgi:O-antigen ligase